VTGESGAWIIWHGLIIVLYILYGWGSCLVEDRDQAWSVAPWYGVAALLVFLCSWPWALIWKGRFRSAGDEEDSRGQLQQRVLASFVGTTPVFVGTLVTQICLMLLVYRPQDATLWVVSFALISAVLAAFGSYFFIGDPGMANLESLDKWLERQTSGQKSLGDLPKALVGGLEAELAMLRSITTGLIYLYVVVGAGVLLGLDKIPLLLGKRNFASVSLGAQIWFIVGVALLLIGCHASITGAVYDRYYGVARWLRRSGTTGTERNTGSDSKQAVEERTHGR